ncbi:NmrA family NAD(P)-binding protein [Streptomyces sp. NPDC053720]|uniref:SDR family oxidoreductase n=1 Tax=Streptomyces sp. NPDC053720 TaxID=3154855 RepID=UPI0034402439
MILVTGATGTIGRYLVEALTEADVPFRALVRDARRGKELGCEFVVGDFDDPASMVSALKGSTVSCSTVVARSPWPVSSRWSGNRPVSSTRRGLSGSRGW